MKLQANFHFLNRLVKIIKQIYSPGNRERSAVLLNYNDGSIKKKLTKLEQNVISDTKFQNGVLWSGFSIFKIQSYKCHRNPQKCITKLFTNEKNFNGRFLLKHYFFRLMLTIFVALSGTLLDF